MQVNFNNKIQFIINFLKHPSFILIIISLVIFNFGWVSRNFAICSFSSTTFLIAIMLKFKKIKNLMIILIFLAFKNCDTVLQVDKGNIKRIDNFNG